tara:strand:- start:976 stop:1641 length:666 start_codon:yes stop_codon:yes gene_type:complete
LFSCGSSQHENIAKGYALEDIGGTPASLEEAWEPEIFRVDSTPKLVVTAILDDLSVGSKDLHDLITNPQIERGQRTSTGVKIYTGIGYWSLDCSVNRSNIPHQIWEKKCPVGGKYKLYSIAVSPRTIEGQSLSISNEEESDLAVSLNQLKSFLKNNGYIFDDWSDAYVKNGAYSIPYPLRVLAAYKTGKLLVIKSLPTRSQKLEKLESLEVYLIDKDVELP